MYSIQGRRRAYGKSLSTLMIAIMVATQFAALVGPSIAHAASDSVSINAVSTNGCGAQTVTISGKLSGNGNRHLAVYINNAAVYENDYHSPSNTS